MKVSVLGDLFVTNEVLQGSLEEAFAGTDYRFEYNYLTDTWQVSPVMKTGEISEFVGNEEDVLEVVGETEIILTHTAPITARVVAAAPKLKIVGAARGGPVNILESLHGTGHSGPVARVATLAVASSPSG
jgi:D-3-phosphoglycerate dehydrogenase